MAKKNTKHSNVVLGADAITNDRNDLPNTFVVKASVCVDA